MTDYLEKVRSHVESGKEDFSSLGLEDQIELAGLWLQQQGADERTQGFIDCGTGGLFGVPELANAFCRNMAEINQPRSGGSGPPTISEAVRYFQTTLATECAEPIQQDFDATWWELSQGSFELSDDEDARRADIRGPCLGVGDVAMSGHTPGPWTAYIHDAAQQSVVFVNGVEKTIYQQSVAALDEQPERFANAHLIAAAPKLLKALKRLASGDWECHWHCEQAGDKCDCWQEIAQEAIAEVEGYDDD